MENNKNTNPAQEGYGFEEHVAKESSFIFGLNAGNVRLTKFSFTKTGGKDGAAVDAMDIMFTIEGNERGYRKFPITKAFAKDDAGNQIEVTDPQHPNFIAAKRELSSVLVHIVGCFVEKSEIQAALAVQIQSFEHFAGILSSLLPKGFEEIPLDGFGQWQWSIGGEAKVTYLEFPKNMKHGRWLNKAIAPKDKWEKQVKLNASTSEVALRYVDADGIVHPFSRNGWYMESNFATQQKEASSAGASAMQGGASEGGDW